MEFLNWIRLQWDRALAVALALAGVVVLVIGWVRISGTGYVAKQLPVLISAGFAGVLLVGAAGVLWLSADLRDEWRELRAVRKRLDADDRVTRTLAADTDLLTLADRPPRPVRRVKRPSRAGAA
jgi:hypothetical protein